jgi:hypothetical protein
MKKRGIVFLILLLPMIAFLWWWPRPASEEVPSKLTPTQRVQSGAQKLRAATSTLDSQNTFAELRAALRQMDTTEAREWLLAQLTSGEDFATQLDLTLDPAQNLSGWPSWRVFLLDLLFLTDPEAAATVSRDLLQTSKSPDEWAVLMRNLARVGKDDALLKTKSAELLRNRDWQKEPSAGYLEAFDVIVHTRNTALAPDLLSNCDLREQKAVRHASFLTLDRLILAAPDKVLPELAAAASNHPQSALMLSNMIARADVRDAMQRQAVETYLLDTRRTAEELRGFASVFPNANIAVSSNLLTQSPTVQGADLADRDRASYALLSSWLTDQRFKQSHEVLRTIVMRLESWRSVGNR